MEFPLPFAASLSLIGAATGMDRARLQGIVTRRIHPWRTFAIRKRSGGVRTVCVPDADLLALQRWIHRELLCHPASLGLVAPQAMAYRPGGSHLANAQQHLGAAWLLKLDMVRFFESVSERQVWHVFRRLGFAPRTALWLTRVCTRVLPLGVDRRHLEATARWRTGAHVPGLGVPRVVGHLPQGAPTSPMLANLVCHALDQQMQRLADLHRLHYTRYADDLTFSGRERFREAVDAQVAALLPEATCIVARYGFGVQWRKTQLLRPGAPRIVTGVSVQGEVLHLPRAFKDSLRQALHHLAQQGLEGHCAHRQIEDPQRYLARLQGQLTYLQSVEPQRGARMLAQFDQMFAGHPLVATRLRTR